MARRKAREIRHADEIGLLASPLRIDLVDTLESLGTAATVAELAALVGRPADSLYYHLRALVAGGLVEEQAAPEGRRYRTQPGSRMRLCYRPGVNPEAAAAGRVAASVLRVAGRDFTRALADPQTVVDGPQRELWVGRCKGWVRKDDLAEINALLARLGDLVQRPPGGRARARLVALTWALAPVPARPARRTPARKPRRTG